MNKFENRLQEEADKLLQAAIDEFNERLALSNSFNDLIAAQEKTGLEGFADKLGSVAGKYDADISDIKLHVEAGKNGKAEFKIELDGEYIGTLRQNQNETLTKQVYNKPRSEAIESIIGDSPDLSGKSELEKEVIEEAEKEMEESFEKGEDAVTVLPHNENGKVKTPTELENERYNAEKAQKESLGQKLSPLDEMKHKHNLRMAERREAQMSVEDKRAAVGAMENNVDVAESTYKQCVKVYNENRAQLRAEEERLAVVKSMYEGRNDAESAKIIANIEKTVDKFQKQYDHAQEAMIASYEKYMDTDKELANVKAEYLAAHVNTGNFATKEFIKIGDTAEEHAKAAKSVKDLGLDVKALKVQEKFLYKDEKTVAKEELKLTKELKKACIVEKNLKAKIEDARGKGKSTTRDEARLAENKVHIANLIEGVSDKAALRAHLASERADVQDELNRITEKHKLIDGRVDHGAISAVKEEFFSMDLDAKIKNAQARVNVNNKGMKRPEDRINSTRQSINDLSK